MLLTLLEHYTAAQHLALAVMIALFSRLSGTYSVVHYAERRIRLYQILKSFPQDEK